MKLEFSLTSKVNPAADCRISLDCSIEELGVILADPMYQEIGHVLATKLSQSSRPNRSNDRNQSDCQQEVRETFQKRQHEARREHDEAVKKVLRTINDRMDALRRNGKPGWGEL